MWFFRHVKGDSMRPTLRPGQMVIAHFSRHFKVGQVVVAFVNGKEVIKRVYKVEQGQVYLKGDNEELSTDSRHYGPVADRNVEGVVIWPRISKKL